MTNFSIFSWILRILLWKAATRRWKGLVFWRNTLGWIRVIKKKFEKKIFGGLGMSGREKTAFFYIQKTWIIDFYVKSSMDWLVFWRKKIDYLIRKHFSFISVLQLTKWTLVSQKIIFSKNCQKFCLKIFLTTWVQMTPRKNSLDLVVTPVSKFEGAG